MFESLSDKLKRTLKNLRGEGVLTKEHATIIDHIDLIKKGRVRRAKLYYLRGLRGKAARIRERDTRGQQNEGAQATGAGKK